MIQYQSFYNYKEGHESWLSAPLFGAYEKKARSTNKFRYQANRAYIIGRLKWFVPRFLSKTSTMLALDDIFEGAVAVRSQIQPGRKDKRNKRNSDRERKHFNNRKRVI
jgi:hypothetical protein